MTGGGVPPGRNPTGSADEYGTSSSELGFEVGTTIDFHQEKV